VPNPFVGKYVYFKSEVYQNWDYKAHAGAISGVTVHLDTNECGWMEEQPMTTVDTMLQLLETPALADRWVLPTLLAAPLVRVKIPDSATPEPSEAADTPFFACGAAKRLKAGMKRTFNDFFVMARARADKAAAERKAAAWLQIENATAVLSRILGSLADAKQLCRAGEVKWSWYMAAQEDIAWQHICEFPLLSAVQYICEFPLLSAVYRSHPQGQHTNRSAAVVKDVSFKGLHVQRVMANKVAAAPVANPLLPDAGRSAYLIGIELTNSSNDKCTSLLTTLTDMSALSEARELALVLEVPESPWISTARFNPLLSLSLVRKRDGRVLVLAQGVESGSASQSPIVAIHWQMQRTELDDVPFFKPYFEANIFSVAEERQLPSSTSAASTVPGLTMTGMSIALEDRSELDEFCSMSNISELLHALESPAIANRWV
jgi:hypothetical protein